MLGQLTSERTLTGPALYDVVGLNAMYSRVICVEWLVVARSFCANFPSSVRWRFREHSRCAHAIAMCSAQTAAAAVDDGDDAQLLLVAAYERTCIHSCSVYFRTYTYVQTELTRRRRCRACSDNDRAMRARISLKNAATHAAQHIPNTVRVCMQCVDYSVCVFVRQFTVRDSRTASQTNNHTRTRKCACAHSTQSAYSLRDLETVATAATLATACGETTHIVLVPEPVICCAKPSPPLADSERIFRITCCLAEVCVVVRKVRRMLALEYVAER